MFVLQFLMSYFLSSWVGLISSTPKQNYLVDICTVVNHVAIHDTHTPGSSGIDCNMDKQNDENRVFTEYFQFSHLFSIL